jgi:hypothetical protein
MVSPVALDLSPLFARAFLTADAAQANTALDEARSLTGGRSWEALVPPEPDEAWLDGTLLHKLVYYCEATRAPLPECGDVFVSFFHGDRLSCVHATEVIAFARAALSVSTEDLVLRHGTGEVRHALRPD